MDTADSGAHRIAVAAAIVRHLRTDPALPGNLLPADWAAPTYAPHTGTTRTNSNVNRLRVLVSRRTNPLAFRAAGCCVAFLLSPVSSALLAPTELRLSNEVRELDDEMFGQGLAVVVPYPNRP
jgi:hypothetical protein